MCEEKCPWLLNTLTESKEEINIDQLTLVRARYFYMLLGERENVIQQTFTPSILFRL